MITVYGHTGVVGGQLYRWLMHQGQHVAGISLDGRDGDHQERPRWAFLCLPTLNDAAGVQDVSAIEQVCAQLQAQGAEYVVIRSTVLPGTTARLQSTYYDMTFYHWPEFLSARTAWRDFCTPEICFVGCSRTHEARRRWQDEIEPMMPIPYGPTRFVSTDTSEALKYAHNIHGAMQVIYANAMFDMCAVSEASWLDVRDLLPQVGYVSERTADSYWDVWKDGKRGYGGACFPKDVAALQVWLQERQPYPAELLDGIQSANMWLREGAE